MMVNKLLATGILVPILILTVPNVYASNLSDTQRYNDGYSNGAQAAAADSTYNPTCDPTGAYTSGGGHTPTYCSGWANGYTATWNANHVASGSGLQPTQPASQPGIAVAQNTTSGASPWHDFGEGLPIHVTTNVYHNENGVFIPWSSICSKGQGYLVQPCSALVDSNGALTPAGDKAVNCIRNGLAAGIAATKVGLPLNLTKGILGFVAPLTGCGGIVDMNKIPTSNEFQYVLRSAVP
jgi:hypothetical protein